MNYNEVLKLVSYIFGLISLGISIGMYWHNDTPEATFYLIYAVWLLRNAEKIEI